MFRAWFLVVLAPRKQLGQPRDADGDPSRLVFRQHLRLPRFGFVFAGVEVRQRLPIGVPDDVSAGHPVGAPGRREAAGWFCHGLRATVAGQLLWPDQKLWRLQLNLRKHQGKDDRDRRQQHGSAFCGG
jgi:hypothetical protein